MKPEEKHLAASRRYRLSADEALKSALSLGNPWAPFNIRSVARQAVVEAINPALAAQLRAEAEARP